MRQTDGNHGTVRFITADGRITVGEDDAADLAGQLLADQGAAARFFAGLPADTFDSIGRSFRQVRDDRTDAALVRKVRAKLAELRLLDQVRAVVFDADQWDDGWFVSVHGNVHLRDGSIYGSAGDVEFDVEAEMRALRGLGRVYPGFAVLLYPEGTFEEDSVQVVIATSTADRWEKLADIRREQG